MSLEESKHDQFLYFRHYFFLWLCWAYNLEAPVPFHRFQTSIRLERDLQGGITVVEIAIALEAESIKDWRSKKNAVELYLIICKYIVSIYLKHWKFAIKFFYIVLQPWSPKVCYWSWSLGIRCCHRKSRLAKHRCWVSKIGTPLKSWCTYSWINQ